MKFLTSGIIILIILSVCLSWAEDYDFRKTRWRMTKEEVKASESLKPIYESNSGDLSLIVYEVSLLNYYVYLWYQFNNKDDLIAAGYMYSGTEFDTESDYLSVYETFRHTLTNELGEPKSNEQNLIYGYLSSEWTSGKNNVYLLYEKNSKMKSPFVTINHFWNKFINREELKKNF